LAALSTQVALGAHFAAAHARAHSCFGSHGRGSAANGSPSKSGAGPGAATAEAEAAGAPRAAAAVLGPKLRPKVVTLLELTLVAAARGGTADRSVISHSIQVKHNAAIPFCLLPPSCFIFFCCFENCKLKVQRHGRGLAVRSGHLRRVRGNLRRGRASS
jgi:hypothetical protein